MGGAFGHIIEWFDWTIYATLAAVFSKQFFPSDDPAVSVLIAMAGFAGGYVMRPIGAIVLSPLADRYGRQRLLSLTIILMGLGSLIIGITPSYETISVAAPILIIFARLLQGFSAGGEYQAATVYIVENSKPGRITFYSSLNYVSIGLAILLANAIAALVTNFIPPLLSTFGVGASLSSSQRLSRFMDCTSVGSSQAPSHLRKSSRRGQSTKHPFAQRSLVIQSSALSCSGSPAIR